MTSFKNEAVRIIDKFNGKKINVWKFIIKMLLAFMNLWDIVNGSEEPPPPNAYSKVVKKYQGRVKKAISIIGLNLVNNQLAHMKSVEDVENPLQYS